MNTKLRIITSIALLLLLSACATFDNITKIPVENLRVAPEYESADLYEGKLLALTVFSPDGSYDEFRYGDPSLIMHGQLFGSVVKAKRPAIDLVTLEQISDKLPNKELASLTRRIGGKTIAAPEDISALANLSGASYVAIAKIRGFSSDQEVYIDTQNAFNTRMIDYKSARSSFTIYDAKTGENIWFGSFDYTSDDSWGEPSWQYMMERMFEGFVLRLPTPSKPV